MIIRYITCTLYIVKVNLSPLIWNCLWNILGMDTWILTLRRPAFPSPSVPIHPTWTLVQSTVQTVHYSKLSCHQWCNCRLVWIHWDWVVEYGNETRPVVEFTLQLWGCLLKYTYTPWSSSYSLELCPFQLPGFPSSHPLLMSTQTCWLLCVATPTHVLQTMDPAVAISIAVGLLTLLALIVLYYLKLPEKQLVKYNYMSDGCNR